MQFLGTSVDAATGLVSLVSEFMHAGSLDNLFRRNEAVSLGQATEMALDVARGMVRPVLLDLGFLQLTPRCALETKL